MSSPPIDAKGLAAELLGEPVTVEPVGRGGNSRVYQVTARSGCFALKLYPRDTTRDRLGQEYEALEFLATTSVGGVPRPIGYSREHGAALFTWLDGTPPDARSPGDVAQLAGFLAAVHQASGRPEAVTIRPASEAVLSSAELLRQLAARLDRLARPARANPALREVLGGIAAELDRRGRPEFPELSRAAQTLSPSDIGFHNALRQADGTLVFMDFEYFGWDDPVKLVSDVLWHPGHGLSAAESVEFRTLAAEIYSTGRDFEARFDAFFPLFGLRWAMIVLNEFLPDARERREFAGLSGDRLDIEERQLGKARDLVERVRNSGS
jgi:hypothetical protein